MYEKAKGTQQTSPADSPAEEKKRGRKKYSLIWNHCFTKNVDGQVLTYCKYCTTVGWKLQGSTSTALSQCCFPMINFEKKYLTEIIYAPYRLYVCDILSANKT